MDSEVQSETYFQGKINHSHIRDFTVLSLSFLIERKEEKSVYL